MISLVNLNAVSARITNAVSIPYRTITFRCPGGARYSPGGAAAPLEGPLLAAATTVA